MKRPEGKSKPDRPPPPNTNNERRSPNFATLQRQTSITAETIREDDEGKAIKEWNEIISICRDVCILCYFLTQL